MVMVSKDRMKIGGRKNCKKCKERWREIGKNEADYRSLAMVWTSDDGWRRLIGLV